MELFKILGRIALEGADEAGSKMDKLKGIASKLGNGVKVAGKAFAGLSTAVGGIAVAVGAASVKMGAAFDSQMSTVQSISGATAEEFEMLRAKAQEMGATTSFSATESAQAFEYMAMAGWDAQQMSDGLAGVMNLAAASGEDLASASDIVTDAMTAFGMKAEESTYFSDVLAQTASSANTNVSMMGETFKYVAPLAGAMGYSIEDMSVAIGLMANSGIKGSQSGTSLRNIITNLASPTDKVSRAMDDLGISLTDNDGNVKTFGETLGDLRESFADLDEVERTLYASSIAGKEGMSGFLALVNSSDEDFEKLTKQIENCEGAAQKMADVRMDNLSGDVTLFKSALEGAGIAISDQLSPVLRDFVQNATAMIPKAQDSIAKFGGKIAEIGSKLLPVLIDTVEELAPVVSEVLDVISNLIPYISDMVESLLPLVEPLLDLIIEPLEALIHYIIPPLTKLIDNIARVLKPVIKLLTPIVDGVAAIVSLMGGTAIEIISSFFNLFSGAEEDMIKLSDAEQATADKTKELTESLEKSKDKRNEAMKSIDSEFGYYERLWGELETIVDENGKIKEGYEDRAAVITGVLSEATGVEMEITGNQIQNYKDLKDSIYDAIEAEKYKAKIEAGREDYNQAVSKYDEYFENMVNAQNNAANNTMEIMSRKVALTNYKNMSIEEINSILNPERHHVEEYGSAYYALIEEIKQLEANQSTLDQITENAIKDFNGVANTIRNGEEAIVMLEKGTDNLNDFGIAALKMNTDFKTANTATLDELQEQSNAYKQSWEERLEAYKKGTEGVTAEEADLLRQLYVLSLREESNFNMSGKKQGQAHANGLASQKGNVKGAAKSLGDAGIDGLLSADFFSAAQCIVDTVNSGLNSRAGQIYSTASSIASTISQTLSSVSIDISTSVSSTRNKLSSYAPKTATGGIVTRAQTRIVGEDGAEAIIPLEKNTGWIDKVASRINSNVGSNSEILEKLNELIDVMKQQKVYLDSGTLVGEIAPKMDKKLGSIARRKMRGAVR